MNLKGTYRLVYVADKEQKELTVLVELIVVEGLKQPYQNVYCGNAYVNGHAYEDEWLANCVDAKVAAERIGLEHKKKIVDRLKKDGKRIRIKKEELK